jgi:hypothetical protein
VPGNAGLPFNISPSDVMMIHLWGLGYIIYMILTEITSRDVLLYQMHLS